MISVEKKENFKLFSLLKDLNKERITLTPSPPSPCGQAIIIARIIARFAQQEPGNYAAHYQVLKNKVLVANPHLPFHFEVGKASGLGIFVGAGNSNTEGVSPPVLLERWPGHGRSLLFGRVVFQDKEGRFYRDLDLKGIGYTGTDLQVGQEVKGWADKAGLLSKSWAEKDYEYSEKLLALGVRTHRVLALLQPEELIMNGQIVTVEQAQKELWNNQSFEPVIAVRAFGTKARVADLVGKHYSFHFHDLLLDDAVELVAWELHCSTVFSFGTTDYLDWFAQTLGKNLALMHQGGLIHNFLTPHNVTLDCRLTDLDTTSAVNSSSSPEAFGSRERDLTSAKNVLTQLLIGASQRYPHPEDMWQSLETPTMTKFLSSYSKVLEGK